MAGRLRRSTTVFSIDAARDFAAFPEGLRARASKALLVFVFREQQIYFRTHCSS